MSFCPSTIFYSPDAPLPVLTAAAELATLTGATVIHAEPDTSRVAIILATGDELRRFPAAQARLEGDATGEWELIQPIGDSLLIAGATPRNVCHAALAWLADPDRETGRLSRYRFTERFTMWDNTMN